MCSIFLHFFLFLTCVLKTSFCQEVNTPLGKIRGSIKISHNGRNFSAFEGIPYAKPPINERRFEEPKMVESWNDVLEALSPTKCCQIDMIDLISISDAEDCLHINIYVPKEEPDLLDNLDVLVYIHGGSFLYGSGKIDPSYIMDKDVILVSMNYRLGIFGFLSTEDEVVPGNNGLKDQVMALKWIQNNIASFGGNPNSVTIFGISAGGASVHLHYFSDMSQGLFHKGFSLSGVALGPWVLQEQAVEKAKVLAESLNCSTASTLNLVQCLKKKSFKDILDKESLFFDYWFMPFTPFSPVVEKGSKPFLKENPYVLLTRRQVRDLPWMVSTTAHEGMFPTAMLLDDMENINENWNKLAPIFFDYKYTLDPIHHQNVAQKIKKSYLREKVNFTKDNPLELAKIFSDRLMLISSETAIRLQANSNKSPVYYYYFGYLGDDNKSQTVAHGDNKKYFFKDGDGLSVNELEMKDKLLEMLVSFARNGKPTISGVVWEPAAYSTFKYLNISGFDTQDMNLQTAEELAPKEFWKSLGFSENENLETSKEEL